MSDEHRISQISQITPNEEEEPPPLPAVAPFAVQALLNSDAPQTADEGLQTGLHTKRKKRRCEHGNDPYFCNMDGPHCPGKGICPEHRVQKRHCSKCKNPELFCTHGRERPKCLDCKKIGEGGSDICEHEVNRTYCKDCKHVGTGGSSLCEHNILRTFCRDCKKNGTGGASICKHGNRKVICKECKADGTGGFSLCPHFARKDSCQKCLIIGTVGSQFCQHEKARARCLLCKHEGTGGQSLCEHGNNKHFCTMDGASCPGKYICEHSMRKDRCPTCKLNCSDCGKSLGMGAAPSDTPLCISCERKRAQP